MTTDEAQSSAGDGALVRHDNPTTMEEALHNIQSGAAIDPEDRADPDAQACVNDFIDFTEHLPNDINRSLALIESLDRKYIEESTKLHELTKIWGQLPSMPPHARPDPVQLRADISECMAQSRNARVQSAAEATRMRENIEHHYDRIMAINSKLQYMYDHYPDEEEQAAAVAAAIASKSPQISRAPKAAARQEGKKKPPRVPRIIVPGEVLAPYDLDGYDDYSSSDVSSSSEEEEEEEEVEQVARPRGRSTPAPQPRIKVIKGTSGVPKAQKIPKSSTSVPPPSIPVLHLSTSSALAKLKPPPENAVIGSSDAPWGQLTAYELARLRKRMKKNAAWAPSETMIARELKALGRGMDAFKEARKKAEDEGRSFEGHMPTPVVDPDTGAQHMPPGSLSVEALASQEKAKSLINRGMKLNEAKKAKREALAKLAGDEAEESARKMQEMAKALFDPSGSSIQDQQPSSSKAAGKATSKPRVTYKKRKRESVPDLAADTVDPNESQNSIASISQSSQGPQALPGPRPAKRSKPETPVPPPHLAPGTSQISQGSGSHAAIPHSITPILPPVPGQDHTYSTRANSATSPAPSNSGASNTVTTSMIPIKPPAETLVPPPAHSPKKSTTPILPPVRETRKNQAARKQEQQQKENLGLTLANVKPSASRNTSPAALSPMAETESHPAGPAAAEPSSSTTTTLTRRPVSRSGKASSQEPQPSLAVDRPRRASTARNTPAPEKAEAPATKTAAKPRKRKAPGVISRTSSGGNSAVGVRKAAPKKKTTRKAPRGDKNTNGAADAAGAAGDAEIEVDDEGNPIDPNEEKYCICNRVSFGTMIQCDNIDNCKQEWFHLECVGLSDIAGIPRTTKWYCPDCRKVLNIGEKGEVSARGVKA